VTPRSVPTMVSTNSPACLVEACGARRERLTETNIFPSASTTTVAEVMQLSTGAQWTRRRTRPMPCGFTPPQRRDRRRNSTYWGPRKLARLPPVSQWRVLRSSGDPKAGNGRLCALAHRSGRSSFICEAASTQFQGLEVAVPSDLFSWDGSSPSRTGISRHSEVECMGGTFPNV